MILRRKTRCIRCILSHRCHVPTIEEKVLIAAPVERVFSRLSEPESSPEWMPHLLKAERTSETKAGPGLEAALLAKVGGHESRGSARCLDWDPPHRFVLESTFEVGMATTTVFELRESGSKTEVTARVDYDIKSEGLGRLVGSLLGEPLARRDLRKALANLRSQLEAGH